MLYDLKESGCGGMGVWEDKGHVEVQPHYNADCTVLSHLHQSRLHPEMCVEYI